ncbi:hypothetical protein M569_05620, partial [Genlisea aurea]
GSLTWRGILKWRPSPGLQFCFVSEIDRYFLALSSQDPYISPFLIFAHHYRFRRFFAYLSDLVFFFFCVFNR